MAYVNRPKGIGQTQFVGPCQGTQVMDPTTGACVDPSVLQGELSNYQAGTNYLTDLLSQSSGQNNTLMIAGIALLGLVIFSSMGKR